PLDILATGEPENFHFASQELRLTSTGQGALSYIGGVYFSETTLSGNTHAELGADILPAVGIPEIPDYRESVQTNSHLLQKSYAAFGSATFKTSARIALTAGLRYTDERKTLDYDQVVSPFFVAPDTPVGLIYAFAQDVSPLRQRYSKGVFSGDATASYQWSRDVHSYLRLARGYKAGGFDTTQSSTSDPGSRAFNPEYVNLYEIGYKSLFAGRSVRINAAIFYSQHQDKQEQIFNGTDFATNNAASASSRGAEIELTLLPRPDLELNLSVGFADAHYGRFVDKLSGEDYSGNRLPLGARWSIDSSLQYHRPVYRDWGVFSRVEGVYHSDSFTTSDNDLSFQQRENVILNLRLGWARTDESFGVYAWGRNVTDSRFVTGGFTFIGNTFISRNRPTMWGVELRGRW
ncbi:MAG: TonB-dependent receptor, partial [Steroidobacteraceae bacterium]